MLKSAIQNRENSNFASENFSSILDVSRGNVRYCPFLFESDKIKVRGLWGKGTKGKGLTCGSANQGAQTTLTKLVSWGTWLSKGVFIAQGLNPSKPTLRQKML